MLFSLLVYFCFSLSSLISSRFRLSLTRFTAHNFHSWQAPPHLFYSPLFKDSRTATQPVLSEPTLVLFRSFQRSSCRCLVSPLFQMSQPVDVSCCC